MPCTFEKIGNWGIKYLEDGNDGTYGYPMEEYKAMMARNGLEMVSISAPFDELRDSPETILDRARNYGAKYVVCFWISHNGNDFTLDDTKNAIEGFNNAGKLFEEHDILLAYHPHGYEFRPYKSATLMASTNYMDWIAINNRNYENRDSNRSIFLISINGFGYALSPRKLKKTILVVPKLLNL